MEGPVIKTYSRRQPVAEFKTSTKLVPSYDDPKKYPHVRESRLNDQTLQVDTFNDTFDRLLQEPGYLHADQQPTDQSDIALGDTSVASLVDDTFKIPSVKNILKKAGKKAVDEEFDYNFDDAKQTKKITKKKIVSKKRKKVSGNSSEEDTDRKTSDKENPLEHGKKLKKRKTENKGEERKRRESPMKINLGTIENTIRNGIPETSKEFDLDVTQINKSKSVLGKNINTLKQHKNLQNSVQSLRPHLLEITSNIPSSTPIIQKSRLIVDVHSLSPITLDQEKQEYGESSSKIGTIAEQQVQRDLVSNNTDSHDGLGDSLKNLQLLKSKSNLLRNEVPFDHLDDNTSNNDTKLPDSIQNNDNDIIPRKSELVTTNKPKIVVRSVEDSLETSVETLARNPISNSQLMNTFKQQSGGEFNDSPLLFDDTQDSLNLNKENGPISLNKNGGIIPRVIHDFHLCTPEKSGRSSVPENVVTNNFDCKSVSDASKNDSSYYPDDWTNDYNSSYEYSKNKNNSEYEQPENGQDSFKNISNNHQENNLSEHNEETMTDHESQEISIRENTLEQNSEIDNSGVDLPEISKVNNLGESSAIINDCSSELSEGLGSEMVFAKSNSRIIQGNFDNDSMVTDDYSLRMSQNTSQEENADEKTDEDINLLSYKDSSNEKIVRYSNENNDSREGTNKDERQMNFESEQTDKDTSIAVNVEKSMNQFTKKKNGKRNIEEPVIQLMLSDNHIKENSSPKLPEQVSKRRRITKKSKQSEDETILQSHAGKILHDESIENGAEVAEEQFQTQEPNKQNSKKRLRSTQPQDQNFEKEAHALKDDSLNINESLIKVIEEPDKIISHDISQIKSDPRFNGKELIICIPKLNDKNVDKKKNSNRIAKKKTVKKVKTVTNNPKPRKVPIKKNKPAKNQSITIARDSVNISTESGENIPKKLIDKELRILVEKLEIPVVNNSPIFSTKKRISKKTSDGYLRKSKNTIRTKEKKSSSRVEIEIYNDISNKKRKDSLETNVVPDDGILNKSSDGQELCALLSKLDDPVRITTRKNVSKKWERPLAVITEDQPSNIIERDEEEDEEKEEEITKKLSNKKLKILEQEKELLENDLEEEETDTFPTIRLSQPIFLKPGKSWARSLSIINHFHNGQNLDELAVGRGQNWRHSVQTVLNMQSENFSQNDVLNDNNERRTSARNSFAVPMVPLRESKRVSNKMSSGIISPPRHSSRRFSIRIIPSEGRSTFTDDLTSSERISYVTDRSRKTSINRKTSLKIRRDTLIETEEDLIRSAEDIVLRRCKQTSYLPFNVCFPDSYIDNCRKIGEGVYGEVFLFDDGDKKSVIKIIPIEGNELVNCEPQKKFHEILSEIIIAEELHKLRFGSDHNTSGFVGVNRIMCVIGKYPQKLIDLWKKYDFEKNSENDCPSMFGANQLYIILDLAHGGQDLEAYTFQNATESFSVFLQTALTLAVAERSLEFEHRDLHWGNILISKTDETNSVYKLDENNISLNTKGVKVAVIDFTLSRMSYQGCKIFNDLSADPTLFTAQGEYQFDIYRMMKDSVDNDWQKFNPHTNVLWLDYVLDKMITAARYKRKTIKIHKTAISEMKELRKEILNYKSAFDFVSNCEKMTALVTNSDG